MRIKMLCAIVCLMLLFCGINGLEVQAEASYKSYEDASCEIWYEVGEAGITITGYSGTVGDTLILPSGIGGVEVTKIASKAFLNCKGLHKITIPPTVTDIGEFALGYLEENGVCQAYPTFQILGYEGSAAQEYAAANGIGFINCAESYTGLTIQNGEWIYVADDKKDTSFTGLVWYNGAWFYVREGKLDVETIGYVEYNKGLFYIAAGMVVTGANGLVQDPTTQEWYYTAGGQAQTEYTGLALYDGAWFYVTEGRLDTKIAGYVEYDRNLFYVAAGMIMTEAKGLQQDPYTKKWYFVGDGRVQSEYTGLALYDGAWFYVEQGALAEDFIGKVAYDGSNFWVEYGMMQNEPTVGIYSGTPVIPDKVTEENYAVYGFSETDYNEYADYYAISSAEELYGFADLVKDGEVNANAVLTKSIVLNLLDMDENGEVLNGESAHSWTPIGTETAPYDGIFDGMGKCIVGVYFNDDAEDYVGLFGYADGDISNIILVDSYIKGHDYVGGIAGYASGINSECQNRSTVVGNYAVGGVVGKFKGQAYAPKYGISLRSCTSLCLNLGNVKGGSCVGGIVGYNGSGSPISGCCNKGIIIGLADNVGGILGYAEENPRSVGGYIYEYPIEYCQNNGSVSSSGNYVGGIAGHIRGGETISIEDCENVGIVSGDTYIGGIIGSCRSGGILERCNNKGAINGLGDCVGGIAGEHIFWIYNCYNVGNVEAVGDCVGGIIGRNGWMFGFENTAYNTGQIVADGENVGPIVGKESLEDYKKSKDNYYLDTCGVSDEKNIPLSAEAFTSGEVAYLLNGSKSEGELTWYQKIGYDQYPVLYSADNGASDTVYVIENPDTGEVQYTNNNMLVSQ